MAQRETESTIVASKNGLGALTPASKVSTFCFPFVIRLLLCRLFSGVVLWTHSMWRSPRAFVAFVIVFDQKVQRQFCISYYFWWLIALEEVFASFENSNAGATWELQLQYHLEFGVQRTFREMSYADKYVEA